ncbi:MAG: DUF4139 domain-containing protein [Nanoarchaeota archaeon]|nr:DUF4139 domain-containing protein [Nanoarchaeota archaeon]
MTKINKINLFFNAAFIERQLSTTSKDDLVYDLPKNIDEDSIFLSSKGRELKFSVDSYRPKKIKNKVKLGILEANMGKRIAFIISGFVKNYVIEGELERIQSNKYAIIKDAVIMIPGSEKKEKRMLIDINDVDNLSADILPEIQDIPEDEEEENEQKRRLVLSNPPKKVKFDYFIKDASWSPIYRLSLEKKPELLFSAKISNNTDEEWEDVSFNLIGENFEFYHQIPRQMRLRSAALYSHDREFEGDYSTSKEGESFLYSLKNPITIKKDSSSFIPVFRKKIDIKKKYVWEARNNLLLLKLKLLNKSSSPFIAGPVSIFKDNLLIGKSNLPSTMPGYSSEIDISGIKDIRVEKTQDFEEIDSKEKLTRKIAWHYKIINIRDKPFKLIVRDNLSPKAKNIKCHPQFKKKPGNQIEFKIELKPRSEGEIKLEFVEENFK